MRFLSGTRILFHLFLFPYPLPLALEQLKDAKVFTKLDFRSAYNLIPVREGNDWKTSAPSFFQSMINEVLCYVLYKFVIAYIDDILIYSPNYQSHGKHVCLVLHILQQNQLYVNKERISFLGYIIDNKGVSINHDKVDAVLQ